MPKNTFDERLPKQFGDFAETLVMYVLGKHKGMRVALVDHVGADIIAVNKERTARYAISVKGRNFPKSESKGMQFDRHNLDMLRDFAESFALIPVVAFVFADEMEEKQKIRIFLIRLDEMERLAADNDCEFLNYAKSSGGGYQFKYGCSAKKDHLSEIQKAGVVDYTELSFDVIDEGLKL